MADVIDKPHEIIVFKIRKKMPANFLGENVAEGKCIKDCSCDMDFVTENVRKFCSALGTVAECRSQMCSYTIDSFLCNELFSVNFEWIELGEESNDSEDSTKNLSVTSDISATNSDYASNRSNLTSSNESSTINDTIAPPAARELTTVSCELPDVSSTTSGDLNCSFGSHKTSLQTSPSTGKSPNSPSSANLTDSPTLITNTGRQVVLSSSGNKSKSESAILASLIVKEPILKHFKSKINVTSAEQESLSHGQATTPPIGKDLTEETAEALDESMASVDANQEIARNSITVESELHLEKERENELMEPASIHMNVDTPNEKNSLNELESAAMESDPMIQTVGTLSHEDSEGMQTDSDAMVEVGEAEKDSLSTHPAVSEEVTQDTAIAAVDIPTHPSERIALESSSRMSMDATIDTLSRNISNEHNDETLTKSSNASDQSTSSYTSALSQTPSPETHAPVVSQRPTTPSSLDKQGNEEICIENKNHGDNTESLLEQENSLSIEKVEVIETRMHIFDASGGSARVRSVLGTRQSSSTSEIQSIKKTESLQQSHTGEEIDENEKKCIEKDKNDESTLQIQKPLLVEDKTRNNGTEREGINSSATTQAGGVTTRSKSNRPAPASVKRQRADRTAKQNAQAKIRSSFLSPDKNNDGTPSPSKNAESTPKSDLQPCHDKRIRSSDVAQKAVPQTQSSNKLSRTKKGLLETEERSSDVHSSRSSTPTLDEASLPRRARNLRSSPVPATHDSNEQTTTAAPKTVSEPLSSPAEVDPAPATSDLYDSDSGESQCSQISEIPLNVRLEMRGKRHKKLLEKARHCSKNPTRFPRGSGLSGLKRRRDTRKCLSLSLNDNKSVTKKTEFRLPKARAVLTKIREKERMMTVQQGQTEDNKGKREETSAGADDDIQVIEELPTKMVSKTSASCTDKRSRSMDGDIRIQFKKPKPGSTQPSRSPGTHLELEVQMGAAGSSSSSSVEVAAKSSEVVTDLEDGNSWVFTGISSPHKAQQISKGFVGTQADAGTDKGAASNPKQSSDRPLLDKDKRQSLVENPSASNAESHLTQTSRTLRARKSSFDPKMEAIKISPKPVAKTAKEALQQQRKLSAQGSKAKEKSANCDAEQPNRNNSSQKAVSSLILSKEKAIAQIAGSDNDEIEIISPAQSDNLESLKKHKEKGGTEKSELSRSNNEKPPEKSVTTQKAPNVATSRPTSTGQASKSQRSKSPKPLSLVDGEIRVAPRPSSSNSNSTESRVNSTSSRNTRDASDSSGGRGSGGTWRRGDCDVRRNPPPPGTESSVDFESPSGDDGDRYRSNSQNSNGSNRSEGNRGFRGGGHYHHRGGHQQYGSYPGETAPVHRGRGRYDGPRVPRSAFRGGPRPGANAINTLTSQGRYQHPATAFMEGPHRFPLLPPPLMNAQFNPQFVPPFAMQQERVQAMGPPHFHPESQRFHSRRPWPRYGM